MKDCKHLTTHLDFKSKLSNDMNPKTPKKSKVMKDIPYQSIISSLVYAMIGF